MVERSIRRHAGRDRYRPMVPPPALIFGTGSFARVLAFHLPYDIVAFVVDEGLGNADELQGRPVRALADVSPSEGALFVGVGYSRRNACRAEVFARAKKAGFTQPGFSAVRHDVIGEGTFVLPGAFVEPFVQIGCNVVLWSGAHVAHDSVVEDHVFISPGAVVAGHSRIGERSFIGANATVRDGITIGPDCIIGAGAVILHDVPAGSVVKA